MISRDPIAELRQRAREIEAELESAAGPRVRAKVVRGGGAVLAASPESPDDRGLYSVQARLAGEAEVTVYVPDQVSLTDGAVIDVVKGQHGYYFRSIVAPD